MSHLHDARMTRIVGIVLVRNEDLFIEQTIRNVAGFCDRIHVVDHLSYDGTWRILRRLAGELDAIDLRRARYAGVSHRILEEYAGSDTWVFGVDGDELYDPAGLGRLREQLLAGAHREMFRLVGTVLNCDALDRGRALAWGYLAPPSRPITKLYNFGVVDSWTDCPERLHAGKLVLKPGFETSAAVDLNALHGWDDDPLRCLHVCFVRRSSRDREVDGLEVARPTMKEVGIVRRGVLATVSRRLRRRPPAPTVSGWKLEKYARGERVEKDAAPFLASRGAVDASA
ncbi:MAG: glycosyltransferase family 2 protein [Gaiellaceae bacterium]